MPVKINIKKKPQGDNPEVLPVAKTPKTFQHGESSSLAPFKESLPLIPSLIEDTSNIAKYEKKNPFTFDSMPDSMWGSAQVAAVATKINLGLKLHGELEGYTAVSLYNKTGASYVLLVKVTPAEASNFNIFARLETNPIGGKAPPISIKGITDNHLQINDIFFNDIKPILGSLIYGVPLPLQKAILDLNKSFHLDD
jgi:hypothetical protein